MPDGPTPSVHGSPVRTLKTGERVLVVGVVEVVRIDGQRVMVRVHPAAQGLLIPETSKSRRVTTPTS
ncbi:MAG: hypothetical protein KF847_20455 [Pirellulales bacterium]|nr:hypothetical protein [Pirellulales bacterium]